MNERIDKLLVKAGAYFGGEGVNYSNFDPKKFAELIVAECIEQVRGEFLPVLEDKEMMKDTHWDGYVQCGVDSIVAIREHFFGVEE